MTGTVGIVARNQGASLVPLQAWLDWNGALVPLQLWDARQARYVPTLSIPVLEANTPLSLGLELALLDQDAASLRDQLPPGALVDAVVRIALNADGTVSEEACDPQSAGPSGCVHAIDVPVAVGALAPPEEPQTMSPMPLMSVPSLLAGPVRNTSPLAYYKQFSRDVGERSKFKAGVRFDGSATFTGPSGTLGLPGGGALASANASLPLSVFKNDFSFLSVAASAKAPVGGSAASASVLVKLIGVNVYSKSYSADVSVTNPAFPPIVKEGPKYEATFMVGPVPVTVKAGARGEVGLNWQLQLTAKLSQSTLTLSAIPYGNIAGFGSAAVGIPGINFGIEIVLKLVEPKFTAAASATVALLDEGVGPFLRGSLSQVLSHQLTLLSGQMNLVVEVPCLKWCSKKKWGIRFSYPCGFGADDYRVAIVDTPGVQIGPADLFRASQNAFDIYLPCVASTCQQAGAQCGSVANGCGGTMSCGSCGPGYECQANRCVPGVADCRAHPGTTACGSGPTSFCASLSSDHSNCGACGAACAAGQVCFSSACCTPLTPSNRCGPETQCGTVPDGCGGTVSCGDCAAGLVCSGNFCFTVTCSAPTPPPGVRATAIVDHYTGDDASASGICTAYKTITAALAHASSGDVVWVAPGIYGEGWGEQFPLVIPAGVSLIGDEQSKGTDEMTTDLLGGGSIPADGGECAGVVPGNVWGTTVDPQPGSTVAGFRIYNSMAPTPDFQVAAIARKDRVTLRNNTFMSGHGYAVYVCNGARGLVITGNEIQDNAGVGIAFVRGGADTRVEGNNIWGNAVGVRYDSPGGDLGGGPAGSEGGNVIICNGNDIWTSDGSAVYAAYNFWDHVPPTNVCGGGGDFCDAQQRGAVLVTTGAQVTTDPCP
jgi:hypothetical protein